jgi:hypothetical protein
MGARVETEGLGDGDGDGLGETVVGGSGLAGVVVGRVAVTVAVPDPGALAVKKVDDADAPAPGVPEPVQAVAVSAANTVTVLQRTAVSRPRTPPRPVTRRNRMKPPDVPAALRLFPRCGLNKPAFEEETAGPA